MLRSLLKRVKAWRGRRAKRIEERTDRDDIVQHIETVRDLPVDRKAVPSRRKRKVATS